MNAILTRATEDPRWNLDEFFETGRGDVNAIMAHAVNLMPAWPKGRALDFGCGIGRLTCPLADHFEQVVGVDIAESMIADASARHAQRGRCRFELNVKTDLQRFSSGTFDFVLAWIVLQRMPPRLMRGYISEFLRVLAPGGLLVFQLPAEVDDARRDFCEAPVLGGRLKRGIPIPVVRLYREMKYQIYRRFVPHMEMYGMARGLVVEMVERRGGQVRDVRPNQSHGPRTPGFSYWITKPMTELSVRRVRPPASGEL